MSAFSTLGGWIPDNAGALGPFTSKQALLEASARVREPLHVVRDPQGGHIGAAFGGECRPGPLPACPVCEWLGTLPALYPEWLGDRTFQETHGVRFAYVVGEMANGIASEAMVIAAARSGHLGFFGAAGLSLERLERALQHIGQALSGEGNEPSSWGANLIHQPHDAALEERIVELMLQRGVRRMSASAFMGLTPAVVRYACTGLRRAADGRVSRSHYLFPKVSRPEVALRFLSPPPAELLEQLVAAGKLTPLEAELGRTLPLAEDLTVEADSGGHTDNRPLSALFPVIRQLRDDCMARYRYVRPIRLGAAGGIGTPDAVAAAYALGAAYVLTGSVNQAAVESGLSPSGKQMLAEAALTDVGMAPSADMFELGVQVQVLKRGTMFGPRAHQLYALYRDYPDLDRVPETVRAKLEKDLFHRPLDAIWEETQAFFASRDPRQLERAAADPKHKMALVFRWYLGQASRWAITGSPERRADYQIWCGPAIGAFNAWAAGSFLAPLANRTVGQIALNLLEGAAVVTRAQQMRSYGIPVPPEAFYYQPRQLEA